MAYNTVLYCNTILYYTIQLMYYIVQGASKLPALNKSSENFPDISKISFLKITMFFEYTTREKTVRFQRRHHWLYDVHQDAR